MRQISVYVASKRRHAEKIKSSRLDGIHLNARWLDMANLAANAAKPAAHWQKENFNDIRDAEAVLVYAEKGERLVNGLLEAGYAIAHGKVVYCIGSLDPEGQVFWHPDYQPWCRSNPGEIFMARDFATAFRALLGQRDPPGLSAEQEAMARRNNQPGNTSLQGKEGEA